MKIENGHELTFTCFTIFFKFEPGVTITFIRANQILAFKFIWTGFLILETLVAINTHVLSSQTVTVTTTASVRANSVDAFCNFVAVFCTGWAFTGKLLALVNI